MRLWQKTAIGFTLGAVFLTASWKCLIALDEAYPPPLPKRMTTSTEVLDRDGALLRAYATPGGYWRLETKLDEVDTNFVRMLIAFEDKRFYEHSGVDFWAIGRAAYQLIVNQRVVSGGSTLSMQLARLIEPRESRSFGQKFKQLLRALQIERRLEKSEILERYLTLAPYGGNLEGVRSASLSYFGKEPRGLSLSEAALLVALPQRPERRRPDLHPDAAFKARGRVLTRMVDAQLLEAREVERASLEPVPRSRRPMPSLAAHFADQALKRDPTASQHRLTLKRSVQERLEAVAQQSAKAFGPQISVAMLMADSRNGNILAEVGSADYFNATRKGWIDMTRAIRSPGSTLKPFIYGLAFDEGLIAQATIIEDRPQDFAGYRPRNFDLSYQGDVSIRQALQMSLNVPAITLLETVGPLRLVSRIRHSGVSLSLPKDETAGLAIGLGGAGISLRDLVQLYTGLANGGEVSSLRDGTEKAEPIQPSVPILSPQATWQVADILSGVQPPNGAVKIGIAYKTGTSYGYRDAWSIGYDGRHVLGVWVGRADGGSVPGLTGYGSAAPILFEAFSKSSVTYVPFPRAPAGALRTSMNDLPVTQIRFVSGSAPLPAQKKVTEPPPHIVFPPNGARVELKSLTDNKTPLVMKLQGGRPPFRWIANEKVLTRPDRRRTAEWMPDGTGYSTLTVIDAAGRAASTVIYIE
jgi:penicillin-binding protein 1C